MPWKELEDESLDVVVGAYAPKPPGFHYASPPPATMHATMVNRVGARVRNNTLGELLFVSDQIEAELSSEVRNEVQMLRNQLEAAPLITAALLGVLCLCCVGCVRRYVTSPSARDRRRARDVAVARPRRRTLGKGFDDAEQSLELTGVDIEGLESPYEGMYEGTSEDGSALGGRGRATMNGSGGGGGGGGGGRGGGRGGGGGGAGGDGGGDGDGNGNNWTVDLTLVRGYGENKAALSSARAASNSPRSGRIRPRAAPGFGHASSANRTEKAHLAKRALPCLQHRCAAGRVSL